VGGFAPRLLFEFLCLCVAHLDLDGGIANRDWIWEIVIVVSDGIWAGVLSSSVALSFQSLSSGDTLRTEIICQYKQITLIKDAIPSCITLTRLAARLLISHIPQFPLTPFPRPLPALDTSPTNRS